MVTYFENKRRLAWRKKIDAIKRCSHAETVEESNIGSAIEEHVFKEHHPSHIGDRHRMSDHRSARSGKGFEEMLTRFAHLPDAAGAPPNMSLYVDQDRWAHRIVVGNPLRREAINKIRGRRHESLRPALPEGDEPSAGELDQPAAGGPVQS